MAKTKALIIITVILLIMVITLAGAVMIFFEPPKATGKTVVVEIPKGAGLMTISNLLAKNGVVKNAKAFAGLAKFKGLATRLKAGEYKFDIGEPYDQVLNRMAKGKVLLRQFTIPEGYNIYQIAPLLSKNGFGSTTEILRLLRDEGFSRSLKTPTRGLEGYLFPETYSYIKGETLREILQRMVKQFFKVYKEESKGGEKNKKMTMSQIVILASICEKEAVAQKELPLIAGVYLNRLEKNMLLQADPTVIYGLKKFDRLLSRKDLRAPSPYNTYLNKGLPPGPIACPGRKAIRGVLNPEKTSAFYFVARNDGTHHFSKTYDQHLKAISLYRSANR